MQVIREMPLRYLFGLTNFKTYCRVWIEKRKLGSEVFLSGMMFGKILPHYFYYRCRKVWK